MWTSLLAAKQQPPPAASGGEEESYPFHRPPLGPLGFEGAQHRQTLRPSVDGALVAMREKALLWIYELVCFCAASVGQVMSLPLRLITCPTDAHASRIFVH